MEAKHIYYFSTFGKSYNEVKAKLSIFKKDGGKTLRLLKKIVTR